MEKRCYFCPRKVGGWSIAAVLKTVEPQGSGGFESLTFRQEKKRLQIGTLQPVSYLGRAEIYSGPDRIQNEMRRWAAVSWLQGDAPGRAGKTSGTEAVRAECSEVNPIKESRGSRSDGDVIPRFSIPAQWPRSLPHWGAKSVRLRPIGGPIQKISVIFVRIFKLNFTMSYQFIERKERSDFRRAQRAVDAWKVAERAVEEGANRPHLRRINPHGEPSRSWPRSATDRRSGRRHERRGI